MHNNNAISISTGNVIKGIALVMMVFHHCYGFTMWYIPGIHPTCQPDFHKTALAFKLCVCIYAFLTGWAYFHHRDKTCKYSITKNISILTEYSIILLFTIGLASIFCSYHLTFDSFINELLPVKKMHRLLRFSWYIGFYLVAMVLLPFIASIFDKKVTLKKLPIVAGVCVIGFSVLAMISSRDACWIICIANGYLCAQYDIPGLISKQLKKIPFYPVAGLILAIGAVWLYFYQSQILSTGTDVLFTPLFCCGVVLMYPFLQKIRFVAPLSFLGKHSLNVWLLHGLFFSTFTRDFFQPAAYAIDSPLYVIPFVLGSCLLVSIVLKPVQNAVRKLVLHGLTETEPPTSSRTES